MVFLNKIEFCRILSLEKLGVVFNQVATPLQYTPRKLVVHPPSSNLLVIETDHNTFTEAAKTARKQQIAEVSGQRGRERDGFRESVWTMVILKVFLESVCYCSNQDSSLSNWTKLQKKLTIF